MSPRRPRYDNNWMEENYPDVQPVGSASMIPVLLSLVLLVFCALMAILYGMP